MPKQVRAIAAACLVAFPAAVSAQAAQRQAVPARPSMAQPVLTPEQKRRLAQTDEFQSAVVKKDAAALKRLLARGVKPDFNFNEAYRGRSGESPLTMAIGRGHLEIARILLEAGADPNRRDDFKQSPLERAHTAQARELLVAHGAQAAPQSSPAQSIAELIDRGDDAGTVKLLLERGADANARTQWKETLVERALFRKRWGILGVLTDAGAVLQAADAPECKEQVWRCHSIQAARLATLDPPTLGRLKARGLDLDRVAANGHTALTSLLVEPPQPRVVGILPDGRRTPALEPPQELPRIRALLENGADPNRRFAELTPLMLAVGVPEKPREIADLIFAAGGRVEFEHTVRKPAPDEKSLAYPLPASPSAAVAIVRAPLIVDHPGLLRGRTLGPVTWLVLHGRADLAARMIQRDGTLAASDRYVLYFAAMRGYWDLVMAALSYAREVDAGDRAGVTPLLLAADDGRLDAVKALLAAGADVNARSDREWPPLWETPPSMLFMGHGPSKPRLVGGYTPLRIAKERGHAEVVRVLQQANGRE